eukprot:UN13118
MIAAGSSGLSLNNEKPRLEEESYDSKSEIGPSQQKSESEEESTSEYAFCVKISEKLKEKGDEDERDKLMSEEDIDGETDSMNLLAEISEEPLKSNR